MGGNGGRFGFLIELDQGMFGLGEMIIDDIRSGSAENARDFKGGSHEAGKTQGGVAGRIFLIVSAFVSFVNDNKTKVVNRGEESGARADDDLGLWVG